MESKNQSWCFINRDCEYTHILFPPPKLELGGCNDTNLTNSSCIVFPFCVQVLSWRVDNTLVRVYDLVLLVLSALFLCFLLIQLVAMVRKLQGSVALFRILYFMVFVIPTMSCLYGVVSMCIGYYTVAAKALHTLLRGSILMTELCVVVFGLFFKFYNNKQCKLAVTVCIILTVAGLFTIIEGVMEYEKPLHLACYDFNFFTHGGMVFLFLTSILFTFAYLITYGMYLFKLHERWSLPSKKSFYRYALFLSLVNLVQTTGSLMWIKGGNNEEVGSAGICLTLITNVIYITTFPPVVYWIFLSNYFRMNKDLKQETAASRDGEINVSVRDKSVDPFKVTSWSITKPLGIRKKSRFPDNSLLAESFGSSSSYGSLNDEETFIKRLNPPDFVK
ncbi:transmembrane protein adipocyte-associated 1 homolog [Halichondria panicea]|uniref:transmembrane protein adipocyte-associated 1 homolog n=1 Tax=Halichondria panicea TaxID=6063 RepID=UPI00312B6045